MSGTHEHLEHAEHAQHHAHSSFDKRVAMSIAIVAATLAAVSLLAHRTHNEVLSLQAESNRYRTESAAAKVEKSNQFAWYQSKRLRQAQSESFVKLAKTLPIVAGKEADRESAEKEWNDDVQKYKKELPDMAKEGDALGEKAKGLDKVAAEKLEAAHYAHLQGNRFDIAHLAVELGLVLCSIAILSKRKIFWFAGMFITVVGIAIAASAYSIPHEHHGDSHGDHPTTEKPH